MPRGVLFRSRAIEYDLCEWCFNARGKVLAYGCVSCLLICVKMVRCARPVFMAFQDFSFAKLLYGHVDNGEPHPDYLLLSGRARASRVFLSL